MTKQEYTPTDQDVETDFSQHQYHCVGGITPSEAHAELHRWLAEHDRQVAERAWGEGAAWAAEELNGSDWVSRHAPKSNPHRKEATGD